MFLNFRSSSSTHFLDGILQHNNNIFVSHDVVSSFITLLIHTIIIIISLLLFTTLHSFPNRSLLNVCFNHSILLRTGSTIMIKLSTIFIFAFALFAIVAPIKGHGDHEDDEEHEMIFYKLTTTELPMGLSDMTATLMDSFRVDGDEAVILVGGCSGSNTLGYYGYACTEITNKTYVFYTSTESFNDQQVRSIQSSIISIVLKIYKILCLKTNYLYCCSCCFFFFF